MKAPYTIELTQLDDRSICVRVGCKALSYRPNDPRMLDDLVSYFTDPEGTIRRFSEGFGWALGVPDAPLPREADPRQPPGTIAYSSRGVSMPPPNERAARNISSEDRADRDRA